jgi:hypothetical protein
VIKNPDKAIVPDNASVLYAITTALSCHATKETADAIIQYGARIADKLTSGKGMEIRMHRLCGIKMQPAGAKSANQGMLDFWSTKRGAKWTMENAQYVSGGAMLGKV